MKNAKAELWSRVVLYGLGVAVAAGIVTWSATRAAEVNPPDDYDVFAEIEIRKRVLEGDARGAVSLARELRERFPGSARPALLEGLVHERCEAHAEAIRCYRDAVPLVENEAQRRDVLLSIGDLHRRSGDHPAAEAAYREAVATLGESGRSLRLRVLVLCDQRRFDDALSEIRRVAEEVEEPELVSDLRRHVLALRSGDDGEILETRGASAAVETR